MTLDQYRRQVGWSLAELARQAHLDQNTVRRAMAGEGVSGRTATSLAQAISNGLQQQIHFSQIEGLKVNL